MNTIYADYQTEVFGLGYHHKLFGYVEREVLSSACNWSNRMDEESRV